MGNIFTLDSLREEVEKEFAPVKIDLGDGVTVTLRNLLRVPKTNRIKAFELVDKLTEMSKDVPEDEDQDLESIAAIADLAHELFPLVADTSEGGKKLIELIQDDIPLTLQVFNNWMESTQPGEAPRSDGS